jgi:O-antigen/teichoic acid export membrane protein
LKREFIKNLVWLQALNWLIKPVWILWIERTVQLQLGNEWYGQYFVHFNVGLLFAVLLDAGLNSYISREVATHGKVLHLKRILFLRLVFGGLYVLLVAAVAWWQSLSALLVLLVCINQILASFLLLIRAILQGKHLFISDGVLSVTDRLIAVIGSAVFLYGNREFSGFNGVVVFLLAQTVGYIVALVLGGYFLRFSQNKVQEVSAVFAIPTFKEWLKQVGWYIAMALAMSIFTRVDSLMIRIFSPDVQGAEGIQNAGFFQAGLYAQGYRLLDAALIFSTLLSTQLLPIFSRNISQNKSSETVLWGSFRLVWLVSVSAFLLAVVLGKPIIEMMYKGKWETQSAEMITASWKIFCFLMAAYIPMALIHVFGTYVTAMGELKWLTKIAVLALLINIALNRIFIVEFGALGASWSCLITQGFFAVACIWKITKVNVLKWDIKRLKIIVFTVVLAILALWLNSYLVAQGWSVLYQGLSYFSWIILLFLVAFWEEIKGVLRKVTSR